MPHGRTGSHAAERKRAARLVVVCGLASLAVVVAMSGCAGKVGSSASSTAPGTGQGALPDSAYHLDPNLASWVDTQTGYDTSRQWKIDGGSWPILVIMSPSQSPQALVGMRDGLFAKALQPYGITPTLEKLDLPPRTFHALQRSKWPFVYMPLAVFTDYSRSQNNQGGAGGLQYVAIAGSTAGGGYTLVAKDPGIKTVSDLADKTVAQVNSNPVPYTLLVSAAKQAGLKVGDGKGEIHFARGPGGDQLNEYMAGKYDAVISLNILKGQLIALGSHPVTDFSEVGYTPNYTILAVERSVLEQKPDVVKAVLEAHYAANVTAQKEWDSGLKTTLMQSWNDYFASQNSPSAKQRIVASQAAFDALLGNMYPEQRIDPKFLSDSFAAISANGLWGWPGTVDVSKLSALSMYDKILESHGEKPQSSASKP